MFRIILAASILATAGFAAGAHAQADDDVAVSTRDVDFNKPSDVHNLYARIHNAAHEVCSSQSVSTAFNAKREKDCETETVNNAVDNVNQPQLTQLAQRRTGADNQMAARDHGDDNRYASR